MARIEKLERVMDFIVANLKRYDPRTWGRKTECGTTHCVDRKFIDELAQKILGLSDEECEHLFSSHTTLDDVQRMVKNLANGDPINAGAEVAW